MYRTDPELLDEVRDPIAEDETEVVETGEENERAAGEESISTDERTDSDEIDTRPDNAQVSLSEAEGDETDT